MSKHKQKKPRGDYKWQDDFLVQIFDLVRQGLTVQEVADVLKVNIATLKKWVRERLALKQMIRRARGDDRGENGHMETLSEYVFKRLPPRLQEYWHSLKRFDEMDNPTQRIEALLGNQGKQVRQYLLVHAIVACHWNISEACRMVNVSRASFDHWATNDSDFAELIDELLWHKKNWAEAALMGKVAEGDTAAIIFVAKTLNRDRGFNPAHEVKVTGSILHGSVALDDLDLPLETRKQLLEAVRSRRQIEAKLEEPVEVEQ
jgi:hypothetical protein